MIEAPLEARTLIEPALCCAYAAPVASSKPAAAATAVRLHRGDLGKYLLIEHNSKNLINDLPLYLQTERSTAGATLSVMI